MVAPVFIGTLLLALLALLFYVGRMLFLAAGAPGGNFDVPGDSDYLGNLAEANTHGPPHASSLTPHAFGETADISSHSHESGSFDGGSGH